MSTPEEFKALGNAAFAQKDFEGAIENFTKAIEASSTPNHVLYSNRSAAYASMKDYSKALSDANTCIEIKPDWAKGYSRLGAAAFGLEKLDDAEKAYTKCLELDPANKAGKDGLKQVQSHREQQAGGSPFGGTSPFSSAGMIDKLKAHPKTAAYMKDPAFVAKVSNMSGIENPQALLEDPRMMDVMSVVLGFDLPGADEASTEPKAESNAEKKSEVKAEKPAATKKEEDVEMKDAVPSEKEKADKIKAEANALYKKRKFDEAIELYNKAYETFEDITYLNNRAAAEFEKGDYDSAIKTCESAIEQGREVRADYKVIAKSYARIGSCYLKKDELKQAISYFDKSLTEHRTADVLTKLRNTEKLLKKQEAEAYINPEKAEEARLEGAKYFKQGDWPSAVKAYTEMIKRAPNDARGYSNRAAAYIKLMSFPDAVRDCDVAIEKDPNFVKAYIRKASAQLTMKDFKPCLDTLELAGVVDKKHNEGKSAYEISQLYNKAMSQRFAPLDGETQDQTRERLSRDPEVMETLQDPVMQNILQQAQNDPAALQEHMKNPEVFKKINLLISAGIIRTG